MYFEKDIGSEKDFGSKQNFVHEKRILALKILSSKIFLNKK